MRLGLQPITFIEMDTTIKLMKVVVDKHLTGWTDLDKDRLDESYEEILCVGVHQDLPEDIIDEKIGYYCKTNNCDLITSDRTSYIHFFDKGTETVMIKRYGFNEKAGQVVYLLKILMGL